MATNSYPSYRRCLASGGFRPAIDLVKSRLTSCDLCPRRCGVDRTAGELGFCGGGEAAKVSSYGPHFGEEAPLVGSRGSGTIFLTGCNLGCCFCQNYDISHQGHGREVTTEELAEMMLELEAGGCHNINFVTPTHFVPQIMEAIEAAAAEGLAVPIVYNCGGYEDTMALKQLGGLVDIYMPDFKFSGKASAERYLKAGDYPEVARAALKEMHSQVGDLIITDGLARRGLLVRHLVMPGHLEDSREILTFLAAEISRDTFVNVMNQYRPCHEAASFPEIAHRPSGDEFRSTLDIAKEVGLTRVYY